MIDRAALRRSPRRKYHVEVESETVRDTNLSYRSLGILTYCLDQHESWQVRSEQLSRGEGREGRDAVRKSLHQLAKFGYYRLERRRFRDGKTVMGAAISEYPVEQWARDYQIFGEDLTIPVVEQEDGSWKVRYPDDTYGPDGITSGAAPAAADAPADDEQTPASEPEADAAPGPAPETKRALPPAARAAAEGKKRRPAASRSPKKEAGGAANDEPPEPKQKTPAQEVAAWYYDHAMKHLGPYAGPRKSGWYFGLVKLSEQALDAGYEKQQVAKAFQRTGVHWPSAPRFQRALSDERNNVPMPARYGGRAALYNDAATWGHVGGDAQPPVAPTFDEPVFSVVPA